MKEGAFIACSANLQISAYNGLTHQDDVWTSGWRWGVSERLPPVLPVKHLFGSNRLVGSIDDTIFLDDSTKSVAETISEKEQFGSKI